MKYLTKISFMGKEAISLKPSSNIITPCLNSRIKDYGGGELEAPAIKHPLIVGIINFCRPAFESEHLD